MIGINSAIYSTTGQFAGIGFAIPSNTIAKVVPSIITTGSLQHRSLGIAGKTVAFLVMEVMAESPAEEAGIHEITKMYIH